MWCKECQQDVPGVTTTEAGKYVCPRCGESLAPLTTGPDSLVPEAAGGSADACGCGGDCAECPSKGTCQHASTGCPGGCSCGGDAEVVFEPIDEPAEEPSREAVKEPMVTIAPEPPPLADDWELEEQLRHIERVLAVDKLDGKAAALGEPGRTIRLDAAHGGPRDWHVDQAGKKASRRERSARRAGSWAGVLSWSALSLGSMGLACGGVLMAWSMATGRDDLWSIGTPVVLIGQLVLLMGFILQLDRLWHDTRDASEKLDSVDERLDELKTTTSLLGTSHSTPAASFYSHMAGGANPQLLLTDLKHQLDLLAMKLGRSER